MLTSLELRAHPSIPTVVHLLLACCVHLRNAPDRQCLKGLLRHLEECNELLTDRLLSLAVNRSNVSPSKHASVPKLRPYGAQIQNTYVINGRVLSLWCSASRTAWPKQAVTIFSFLSTWQFASQHDKIPHMSKQFSKSVTFFICEIGTTVTASCPSGAGS